MLTVPSCEKRGQSVIVLVALLLVPIAAMVQATVRLVADSDAGNSAVLASTAAATAAASAAAEAEGGVAEGDVITAACEAMDQFLPVQIRSVGATGGSVRVVVSALSRTGNVVTHSFTASFEQASRSGGVLSDREAVFELTGAELAALWPACSGRAS